MKRILIVEDDENMLIFYKSMFEERAGEYEIETESDARKALEKLREKTYDLIILDMIMEPMDGETFFARARENSKTKEIPILVASVLDPKELEHLRKINHVSFLQKPIAEERLFQEIKDMLG